MSAGWLLERVVCYRPPLARLQSSILSGSVVPAANGKRKNSSVFSQLSVALTYARAVCRKLLNKYVDSVAEIDTTLKMSIAQSGRNESTKS